MITQFLAGATFMAYVAIALFFLRFWRTTRDRLFIFFTVSFLLLGLEVLISTVGGHAEFGPNVYLIRLLAFVTIIVGIIDKNRRR